MADISLLYENYYRNAVVIPYIQQQLRERAKTISLAIPPVPEIDPTNPLRNLRDDSGREIDYLA